MRTKTPMLFAICFAFLSGCQEKASISCQPSSGIVSSEASSQIIEQSSIDAISSDSSNFSSSDISFDSSSEDVSSSSEDSSSMHTHNPSEPVKENEKAPTCLEDGGYDLVVYCQEDHVELSRQHIDLPASGHDYSIVTIVKEMTDTEDGLIKRTCSKCGDEKQETIFSPSSYFTYQLNADNASYCVTGYAPENGYSGEDIVIPSSYNGIPVTTIGATSFFMVDRNADAEIVKNRVFINNKNVHINKLPSVYQTSQSKERANNPITSVVDSYPVILEIYYNGSLLDWLNNAPLTNYFSTSSNNPSIRNYLYLLNEETKTYEKVEDLIIPEGVTTIPNYAFTNISFKSITCPSSLLTIGNYAINNNSELQSIDLNEGLTTIGNNFNFCPKLEEVSIPSTFSKRSNIAFAGCQSLTAFHIKKGASNYQNIISMCEHLIKVIDENDDTSYLNGRTLITKDNLSQSAVFDYQGFKMAKIVNKIYILKYVGENVDGILNIPEKVIYNDNEYNEIWLKDYFINMFGAVGLRYSADEILAAYNNDLDEIKLYSPDLLAVNLFFTIHLPKNIKMEEKAFSGVPFLKDIFYDGTYEEWLSIIGQNAGKMDNNFAVMQRTNVVHILVNDEYVDYPLVAAN